MTEPFALTTPSGLIHVTIQPWTEHQRAQAISEIRQVVDSLTTAFLTTAGAVCARSAVPVQAGDLLEIDRFREFLTRAPQAGPTDAYQQVYAERPPTDLASLTDVVREQLAAAGVADAVNYFVGRILKLPDNSTRLDTGTLFIPTELTAQPGDELAARVHEFMSTPTPTVYPSDARAESLHTLTIYGASDDLVEVEGYVREEYNACRRAVTLLVTVPSGARLWVTAEFEPTPLQGVGDGWAIGVLHADPEWTHPLRFTRRPDRDTDPAIELDIPVGTTVTEWGRDE